MSEQDTYQRGERVTVTCHVVHTIYGGLQSESHLHTGTVAMTSVKGNVYVHLDDGAGQPRRCHSRTLTRVGTGS